MRTARPDRGAILGTVPGTRFEGRKAGERGTRRRPGTAACWSLRTRRTAGTYQFLRALRCPPAGAPDACVAGFARSLAHFQCARSLYVAGAFASSAAAGGRLSGGSGGARCVRCRLRRGRLRTSSARAPSLRRRLRLERRRRRTVEWRLRGRPMPGPAAARDFQRRTGPAAAAALGFRGCPQPLVRRMALALCRIGASSSAVFWTVSMVEGLGVSQIFAFVPIYLQRDGRAARRSPRLRRPVQLPDLHRRRAAGPAVGRVGRQVQPQGGHRPERTRRGGRLRACGRRPANRGSWPWRCSSSASSSGNTGRHARGHPRRHAARSPGRRRSPLFGASGPVGFAVGPALGGAHRGRTRLVASRRCSPCRRCCPSARRCW